MAESELSYDFFISRAGTDREIAQSIGSILESAGYKVLLQDWDFGNSDFVSKMDWALTECRRVITILSQAYLESDYCGAEWRCIFREDPKNWGERLLLFRVDQCSPTGLLGLLAYLDLVPIVDLPELLRDVVLASVAVEHRPRDAKLVEPYRREFTPVVDPSIRDTPNFVARTDLLGQIDNVMNSEAQACVLYGMAGSGKSTLATRYALEHQTQFGGIWSIDASNEKGLHQSFIALGQLFLPELSMGGDVERTAQSVVTNIIPHFNRPWLLIIDGVEDPDILRQWLPRHGAKVLATSRRSSWGLEVSALEVCSFEPEDAVDYLVKESGRIEIDDSSWRSIADSVGGLPLALAHIAAFLRRKRTVTAKRLLERMQEVLASSQVGGNATPVDATIEMAIDEASTEFEACRSILEFVALFAPNAIPSEFLQADSSEYPADLARALSDPSDVEDALGLLDELSLIRFHPKENVFDVHQLVQDFVRPQGGGGTELWRVAQKIANRLYAGGVDEAEKTRRYGPHAWHTDMISHQFTGNIEWRKFATDASRRYQDLSSSEWSDIVEDHEQKIATAEGEYGPESEQARSCWNQLALACGWRGDHERHQEAWRRATEILIAQNADRDRIMKHADCYCAALQKGGRKRWQIAQAAAELGIRVAPFDSEYMASSFELDRDIAGMDANDVKHILKEVESRCSPDPQQFLLQIKDRLLNGGCHAGVVRSLIHHFARLLEFNFEDHLILSPPTGLRLTPEEIANLVYGELQNRRALSESLAAIKTNLQANGVQGKPLRDFIQQIALQLGAPDPHE